MLLAGGSFSKCLGQDAISSSLIQTVGEADTSQRTRQEATRQIPMDRLTQVAQQRIQRIIASPTLFRRLPSQRIDCDPEMFIFLVRHPEVMVGIWEVMGITKVHTQRTAPFKLEANDNAGTDCVMDLVYGDHATHLFYAEGEYSGPMVAKPIKGAGVFVLHSRYIKQPDGTVHVVGTLDCFIQLGSLGADLVARTLSGLIGRTADNNFTETARFIAQISRTSTTNPEGMVDLANRLPQVDPSIREKFAEQSRSVYQRSTRTAALLDTTLPAR